MTVMGLRSALDIIVNGLCTPLCRQAVRRVPRTSRSGRCHSTRAAWLLTPACIQAHSAALANG
ncbi:MAG: hypothetical protein RJA70_2254 [Pseudomonadota bacterium]|jgi:hypothetical protein